MYNELLNILTKSEKQRKKLFEGYSKAQIKQLVDDFTPPEILPSDFDITPEDWINRIRKWGVITIYHRNPEEFRGKRKVSPKQFTNKLQSEDLKKMLSGWYVKKIGNTEVKFFKDYIALDSKVYTDEFIIKVKLRKEFKGYKFP